MKARWNYDGTNSNLVIEERDPTKICTECNGFEGHFNECSILKKEIAEGKWT